ncbi:MAG: NTP transferase domain-containing protein [Actinobacteria bacterium]|nr:NTP transferase domain-containing protein [Actinomycetota bacterium]
MAAGEGSRLRPITEHWSKPVLPIDGRPVVVSLIHELAAGGCGPIIVVTGHLAEQVEELLAPLPYEIRFVRQPPGLGSADAVARAEATAPFLVSAADTLYTPGEINRFASGVLSADGAYAVHGSFRPPLWALGPRVARFLDPLPGNAPYELAHVFDNAVAEGAVVRAVEIGPSRDLTSPEDLVRENFDYLRAVRAGAAGV